MFKCFMKLNPELRLLIRLLAFRFAKIYSTIPTIPINILKQKKSLLQQVLSQLVMYKAKQLSVFQMKFGERANVESKFIHVHTTRIRITQKT